MAESNTLVLKVPQMTEADGKSLCRNFEDEFGLECGSMIHDPDASQIRGEWPGPITHFGNAEEFFQDHPAKFGGGRIRPDSVALSIGGPENYLQADFIKVGEHWNVVMGGLGDEDDTETGTVSAQGRSEVSVGRGRYSHAPGHKWELEAVNGEEEEGEGLCMDDQSQWQNTLTGRTPPGSNDQHGPFVPGEPGY